MVLREMLTVLTSIDDFLLRFINLYSLKPMDHIDKQTLRDLLTDFSNENPQFKIDSTTWTGSEDLIGVFTTHLPRRDRFTELLMDLMFCIRRRVGKFSRVSCISSLRAVEFTLFD